MRYVLGIDVGTSGTKTILVDGDRRVVASKTIEYPMETPRPGWTQQDPALWWDAAVKTIRIVLERSGVAAGDIAGVGFSGQMHGMVALDADNRVVRPAILWNDQRTQSQCDEMVAACGGLEGLVKLTNNLMLTGYTGGKILWMKQNEPENFAKTRAVICPKDYIRFMLTGVVATDVADASGTGLFNVRERCWSDEAIEKVGLPRSLFQRAYESYEVAGHVTAEAAKRTGLPEGLPVTAGGGDAVIQTTGTGLVRQGILGVVIGTSGVVAMGLDGFKENPKGELQVFCNNAKHLWHAMGVTLAAGGSYRWFRDELCQDLVKQAAESGCDVYDLMSQEAAGVQPGCGGLLFLPYLSGERCTLSGSRRQGRVLWPRAGARPRGHEPGRHGGGHLLLKAGGRAHLRHGSGHEAREDHPLRGRRQVRGLAPNGRGHLRTARGDHFRLRRGRRLRRGPGGRRGPGPLEGFGGSRRQSRGGNPQPARSEHPGHLREGIPPVRRPVSQPEALLRSSGGTALGLRP